MNLLSFGEVLWDIFPTGNFIGGAPFNFAAHFVKQGGNAAMLTGVGTDELGLAAIKEFESKGVKTEYVSVLKDYPTGRCLVSFDKNNIPSYEIVANTAIDRITTDFDFENKYNLLYFGTLALREEYNRASIEKLVKNNRFEEIFLDINVRKPFINKENVDFALSKATIVKISDEELPLICNYLFGEELDYKTAAERIAKLYRNLELVLITLGSKGAYCLDVLNNKEHSCGIIHVPVASTVGAGDSFSASFLYNFMLGKEIDTCLEIASKVSAFVVSKTEAVPDYNDCSLSKRLKALQQATF